MLSVKRLNLDSSWHIKFDSGNFIIDPGLIGAEIDGFKWLNQQWHIKEPVKVENLPSYDFILISQNYEDHCHINTLKKISDEKPILATEKAFKKLRKEFPQRKVTLLDDNKTPNEISPKLYSPPTCIPKSSGFNVSGGSLFKSFPILPKDLVFDMLLIEYSLSAKLK